MTLLIIQNKDIQTEMDGLYSIQYLKCRFINVMIIGFLKSNYFDKFPLITSIFRSTSHIECYTLDINTFDKQAKVFK